MIRRAVSIPETIESPLSYFKYGTNEEPIYRNIYIVAKDGYGFEADVDFGVSIFGMVEGDQLAMPHYKGSVGFIGLVIGNSPDEPFVGAVINAYSRSTYSFCPISYLKKFYIKKKEIRDPNKRARYRIITEEDLVARKRRESGTATRRVMVRKQER